MVCKELSEASAGTATVTLLNHVLHPGSPTEITTICQMASSKGELLGSPLVSPTGLQEWVGG